MPTPRGDIAAQIEAQADQRTAGLLKFYNYYRVGVGLALLTIFQQPFVPTGLGQLLPEAFFWATLAYTGANLLLALGMQLAPAHWYRNTGPALGVALLDIAALTFLTYASAGVSSGVGVLLLVSVVAGALIVPGRWALVLPAAASIALLYEEFVLSIAAPAYFDDYFQAGILGTLCFAFVLLARGASGRLRQGDARAIEQDIEFRELERTNELIIQRMRTGIVVLDHTGAVRLSNHAARELLGCAPATTLEVLPEKVHAALERWQGDSTARTPAFQIEPHMPEIRVNFSSVGSTGGQSDVTLFIEDTAEVQQHAQQLKLADLGRLTASIAHEIRNPLGAISHAAQLLTESANLDKADTRLTDIIYTHCQRMNGVVENVLEMSRRNPPAPVRLHLANHIDEFVAAYRETDSDAVIEVEVAPPETEVRMDASQLTQVLTNLVANGIRYSEEQGNGRYVRLEGGTDQANDRPFLNVIDRGPGVPPDDKAHLFDPFFTTDQGGTGLGLYISKELCEANQAQLNYIPQAQGGSCFRILFAPPERITN